MGVAGLLAAGALGCALASVPAPTGRPLDLWPFVVRDARSVAGVRTLRAAGPFFRIDESDDGVVRWTAPPWIGHRTPAPGDPRDLTQFLFPLGGVEREAGRVWVRLTPVLDIVEHAAPSGDGSAPAAPKTPVASRWTAGLAFGGRTARGRSYFGVFPFAGVARRRFGVEKLEFLLFPLFARTRDHHGFVRTTLLWPFFSWGSGGGRRLIRFWPFYGHDRRRGDYDRRFFLWPLVHLRHEDIGGLAERRVRLFLPFYGEVRTEHVRARFVFGPLYVHSENAETGARSTDAPWPFVRVAERPARPGRPGMRELRVEPLFGWERTPGRTDLDFLGQAFAHTKARDGTGRLERWRFFWVSRTEWARRAADGAVAVRRDLWPFLRYRSVRVPGEPPRGRLAVPWVLPLSGPGFARYWLDPLTLYSGRWERGESRSDWLWGLVRRRRAPGYSLRAVWWLYRRERADGATRTRWLGLPSPFDRAGSERREASAAR